MNAPKSTFACYDCILLGDIEIKWTKSIGKHESLQGNFPDRLPDGSGRHDVTHLLHYVVSRDWYEDKSASRMKYSCQISFNEKQISRYRLLHCCERKGKNIISHSFASKHKTIIFLVFTWSQKKTKIKTLSFHFDQVKVIFKHIPAGLAFSSVDCFVLKILQWVFSQCVAFSFWVTC